MMRRGAVMPATLDTVDVLEEDQSTPSMESAVNLEWGALIALIDMKVLTVKFLPEPAHESLAWGVEGITLADGTRTELITWTVPLGLVGVINGYFPLVCESSLVSCVEMRAASCPTGKGQSSEKSPWPLAICCWMSWAICTRS